MADLGVSRNAPCPCGSGKKYKKCCLRRLDSSVRQKSDVLLGSLSEIPTRLAQRSRFSAMRGALPRIAPNSLC